MNIIAKLMISWSTESMTCIESSQKHLVQQQDHSMNRLMMAMEEDSEDEAMEKALAVEEDLAVVKALAVAMDLLLVTTMGL